MKPNKQLVDLILSADKAYNEQAAAKNMPDWSDWWAGYLLEFTDFNQLTEREWRKSELAEALVDLKSSYDRQRPKKHWSHFFALRLSS